MTVSAAASALRRTKSLKLVRSSAAARIDALWAGGGSAWGSGRYARRRLAASVFSDAEVTSIPRDHQDWIIESTLRADSRPAPVDCLAFDLFDQPCSHGCLRSLPGLPRDEDHDAHLHRLAAADGRPVLEAHRQAQSQPADASAVQRRRAGRADRSHAARALPPRDHGRAGRAAAPVAPGRDRRHAGPRGHRRRAARTHVDQHHPRI